MTLIAQIDDGACLAHGDCVHAAPGVFMLNGDIAEQHRPGHRRASSAPPRAPAPPARSCCSTQTTGEEVDP